MNVEEVFAAFKAGVAKQISADDAQTHFNLAVAYGEMGLLADAVREAAIALGEAASLPVAGIGRSTGSSRGVGLTQVPCGR